MKSTRHQRILHELDEILALMHVDLQEAATLATVLLARCKSSKLNYVYAKAQLVYLSVHKNALLSEPAKIDGQALRAFFDQHGYEEDAARTLLLVMTNHFFRSEYEQARALDAEFAAQYGHLPSVHLRVQHLIAKANFYLTDDNNTGQLALGIEAEKLIRQIPEQDAWCRSLLSRALQVQAYALSRTAKTEAAEAAIEKAKAVVNVPGISPDVFYYPFHYHAVILSNQNRFEESIALNCAIEKKLAGHPHFEHHLANTYVNMVIDFINLYDMHVGDAAKQKKYLAEQVRCMKALDGLKNARLSPELSGSLLLMKARIARFSAKYDEAIHHLARALRMYAKHELRSHIVEVHQEATELYEQRALKQRKLPLMQKAVRSMKRAQQATFRYNQIEGKEKMDAVINSYELKQKELNEKLLQQTIESMNNEIKMTNLNLHEKVQVLDKLKTYVATLKQKGQESNQIIRQISKEIDKVIITEQDKANFAHKMNEQNAPFYQLLSETHPPLTNLEVRICGLLKTGMTDKELARVYGQSDKSYEQHRYRIKKKMKLAASENLVKYLLKIDMQAHAQKGQKDK